LDGWFIPAMSAIAESEALLKQVRLKGFKVNKKVFL